MKLIREKTPTAPNSEHAAPLKSRDGASKPSVASLWSSQPYRVVYLTQLKGKYDPNERVQRQS